VVFFGEMTAVKLQFVVKYNAMWTTYNKACV